MEVNTYKLISEPVAPATTTATSEAVDSSRPIIQPRPLSSFNIPVDSNIPMPMSDLQQSPYQHTSDLQLAQQQQPYQQPLQSSTEKFHTYLRAKRMVSDEQLARYADRIVYEKPKYGAHQSLYRKVSDVDFDEEDFREEQREDRAKLGSTAGKMMLASSLLGLVLTVMNG
jgi:hypothetical protein